MIRLRPAPHRASYRWFNSAAPLDFDVRATVQFLLPAAVGEMQGDLNDGEDGSPPQLRTDLLKLHQLAMAVINRDVRSQVAGCSI